MSDLKLLRRLTNFVEHLIKNLHDFPGWPFKTGEGFGMRRPELAIVFSGTRNHVSSISKLVEKSLESQFNSLKASDHTGINLNLILYTKMSYRVSDVISRNYQDDSQELISTSASLVALPTMLISSDLARGLFALLSLLIRGCSAVNYGIRPISLHVILCSPIHRHDS